MRISIVIYELFRFITILYSKPEFNIQILPFSWYATAPLAFLPAILAYLTFFHSKEDKTTCEFLYILSKVLMIPGFIAYFIEDIPYAVALGKSNNFYSVKYLFVIALFLLIDVILIIFLTIIIRKKQKNFQKSDYTSGEPQISQSDTDSDKCSDEI
ncbi:MAG: hypothetical protein K5751_07510 [Treponemataceae bacterium]|nr:hypothetical protein [Treponemataceae bacterium]